jgi:hypothetical protein
MAELGVAASILQIAGAGIRLILALHQFGSTAAAAQEEINGTATCVSLYLLTFVASARLCCNDQRIARTISATKERE